MKICSKIGKGVSVLFLSAVLALSFSVSVMAHGVMPECGSADGQTFESQPTENLCAEGYVSGMSEDGEQGWSWVCYSKKSQKTDSCRAYKKPAPEPEPEPTPEPEPEDDNEEDKDCDGSIGDLVWHDRNKNGVRDAGEEGLSGITVKLHRGNDTDKDNTGAKGQYEFDDLCKGKYTVVVDANDLGKGCYPTYDKDGNLDHKTVVRLDDDDDDYKKADFGYYCPTGKTAPRTGAGGVALALSGGAVGLIVFLSRKRFRI